MGIIYLNKESDINDIIEILNRARDGKDVILYKEPTFYKIKLARSNRELKMDLIEKLNINDSNLEKDIKMFFGTYYSDYLKIKKREK